MRYFFALCTVFFSLSSMAQGDLEDANDVVQFSGIVVTGDSLSPVPFVTVYRTRDAKGTITDTKGFFSIPVLKGDTIRFSSIGYVPTQMSISDTLSANRYNVVQFLGVDTVMVATTFIYPWPTKQKMKEEILALRLEDDQAERARKNLESIMMYNRMAEMGMDGSENYKVAMQQQAQRISYAGQAPPQNIFSPIAWAQFIKAWQGGAYKKK
ncbi:MAG: carboxypeptidase-like regulatory domain-containing protein [Flavobacteriales bacterium]|nr:carboxypeptidase-like regulatory domain-containing protein [Flavobacteriales bacterium]